MVSVSTSRGRSGMKLNDAAVLFVEDEPFLRESMGGWLEQHVGPLCARSTARPLWRFWLPTGSICCVRRAHAGHGRHPLGRKTFANSDPHRTSPEPSPHRPTGLSAA